MVTTLDFWDLAPYSSPDCHNARNSWYIYKTDQSIPGINMYSIILEGRYYFF